MRSITISDGVNVITLLKDLEFTVSQEFVGSQADMASGRTVMDIVGVKTVLDIPVGYLSREDISILRDMINTKHILKITYPDLDGDVTDDFYVEPLVLRSFKYGSDGVDVWYGFSLACKLNGVLDA